jgi:predicted CXXCH cytochrome family protein
VKVSIININSLTIVALWLCVSLLLGCSTEQKKEADVTIPPSPKEAVWLVVSGDTRGNLENCGCQDMILGGVATRAEQVRLMREENPNLLLVDMGGNANNTSVSNIARTDATYNAMRLMQYDAVLINKEDLAIGLSLVQDAANSYSPPFLAANLRLLWDDVVPFWRKHIIFERAGLKIGVIGIISPAFLELGSPFTIDEPRDALDKELAALRDKVDVIIVLSESLAPYGNEEYAKIPGIDILVVFDGVWVDQEESNRTTCMMSFGLQGRSLGRIGFEKRDGSLQLGQPQLYPIDSRGPEVVDIRLMIDELAKVYMTDPAMDSFTGGYMLDLPSERDPENFYMGYESCIPCHTDEYKHWSKTHHARAYHTLIREEKQLVTLCVACHVTGLGRVDGFHVKLDGKPMADVQCESCHGPSGRHAQSPEEKGLTRLPERKTCEICHTQKRSPKFSKKFESYWKRASHK